MQRREQFREAVFKYLDENWDDNLDEGLKQKLMSGVLAAGMLAGGAGGNQVSPPRVKGVGGQTFSSPAERSQWAAGQEKKEIEKENAAERKITNADKEVEGKLNKGFEQQKALDKKLYKKK